MKFIYIITLLFVFASLSGCNNKPKETILGYEPDNPLENYQAEKDAVLKRGDIIAYETIRDIFPKEYFEHFLFYALHMSDKYDYVDAYYDVFLCLHSLYKEEDENGLPLLDRLDNLTKDIALYHLMIAAEKGNESAILIFNEYLRQGLYFNKNSIQYEKE